jgi:L-threonylcarbamoyladenylate synthase
MTAQILDIGNSGLDEAARWLRGGELVAFPTETVYGLGADATNDQAVARIYEAKGRPSFNPLIVHFPSVDKVKEQVIWNERAEKLAAAFWPGALTFILPRVEGCQLSLLVSAGLDTVAVRVPAHEAAHSLIEKAEKPIAAPSANSSGKISPTTAAHVQASLGSKISYILDGGISAIGLESTVVDLSGATPSLLRPGAITRSEIEAIIDQIEVLTNEETSPKSPGMLIRHYAPDVPIRLNAIEFSEDENVLGFGPNAPADAFNLSPTGDLIEAAANLFAMLHELDHADANPIAVMPIPDAGLGAAINDRLRRAAARE